MAAPETGGSENGAGRNTLPGTKGQVRFLRQPQPFSLPAGAERVGHWRKLPVNHRQGRALETPSPSCGSGGSNLMTGKGSQRCGRVALGVTSGGAGYPCGVHQILCAGFLVFLRYSPSKGLGFGVPDASHNPLCT